LKVRPRGVVMRWKGVDQDPREVGRELSVQVVVEGSVRRTPAGMRISARVLSVADGFQLWAQRFDRPEKDLFVVTDEVAKAIAEALTVDMAQPVREAPTDPMAVELYLKARVLYRKFWAPYVREAVKLLEQALERAPNDPTILSGYASALSRLAFFSGENAMRAKEVAEQALAVAPHLAEGHLAMGLALFQVGDPSAALRAARQALVRAPALAEAHALLGMILAETGPLDDAVRAFEAAMSLDPAAPSLGRHLSRLLILRGDVDRAMRILDEGRANEGDFSYFASVTRYAMYVRDEKLTSEILKKVETIELTSPVQIALRDALVSKTSPFDVPGFKEVLASHDGGWRRNAFFTQLEVELAAYVGDDARAIARLVPCAQTGLIDLLWLDRCALLDAYRATPEFSAARALVAERAELVIEAYRAA